MAMNVSTTSGGTGGISGFMKDHPTVALGGIIIVVLLGGAYLLKKQSASTAPAASDTSGLATDAAGNRLVYVGATTSFTTENINNTTNNNSNNTNNTGGNSSGVVIQPYPGPKAPPIAKAPPPPPPAKYALVWDQHYMCLAKSTLVQISSSCTGAVKQRGAPNSTVVTWQQIYAWNKGTLDNLAKKYNYKSTNLANMQFHGGEMIIIPQWKKVG